MLPTWVSPPDLVREAVLAELGPASTPERATVWLLGGEHALTRAEAATSDQIVILLLPADQLDEAPWDKLGVVVDDIASTDATGAELAARVRACQHDRRTGPRSRILRLLAHDLNNPLTAIRLLSEVLTYEISGQEAREDMADILEASDAAAALIESLSAYAKLHSPGRSGRSTVDLARVLTQAAGRPSLKAGLTLHPPKGPLPVRGDPAALTQAVVDMLLNGRRLSDTVGDCVVHAEDDGSDITIDVRAPVHRLPERLSLLTDAHGPGLLRDQRIPVTPTGLVHASRTAQAVGGRLELTGEDQALRMRLILPRAGRG